MEQLEKFLEMLTYKRPHGYRAEQEFISRFLNPVKGMRQDYFGNIIYRHPISTVMFTCHTDTVHYEEGRQKVEVVDSTVKLPDNSTSNCLGADCTTGVFTCLRLIEAGVPATFVFHRGEEVGGLGSEWLADFYPDWVSSFTHCISLDRRGFSDIIVKQVTGPCCSTEFAHHLGDTLGMGHKPAKGIFTDSANYAHLIPECTNVSVGYLGEHTRNEVQHLDYLERLIGRLCMVDWQNLPVYREV